MIDIEQQKAFYYDKKFDCSNEKEYLIRLKMLFRSNMLGVLNSKIIYTNMNKLFWSNYGKSWCR